MSRHEEQVVDWLKTAGFVRTAGWEGRADNKGYWELAWSHTSGYGYITFRVGFLADSFEVIILEGETGINIGTVTTVDELRKLYDILSAMTFKADSLERLRKLWPPGKKAASPPD